MSQGEQFSYVTGAIDMAMYNASKDGNGQKAECILRWFYGKDDEGVEEVVAVFDNYKDKPAIPLLQVLINRHCK